MFSEPVVMDELHSIHTSFVLNFYFQNNITFLMGDSGIGKSFIYSILQETSVEDERIICINYLDVHKNIFYIIQNAKKKLVIIDNADSLLTDEMRKWIAFDRDNQYLIIGRNPSNLMLTKENLFELIRKEENGIISFSIKKIFD